MRRANSHVQGAVATGQHAHCARHEDERKQRRHKERPERQRDVERRQHDHANKVLKVHQIVMRYALADKDACASVNVSGEKRTTIETQKRRRLTMMMHFVNTNDVINQRYDARKGEN